MAGLGVATSKLMSINELCYEKITDNILVSLELVTSKQTFFLEWRHGEKEITEKGVMNINDLQSSSSQIKGVKSRGKFSRALN